MTDTKRVTAPFTFVSGKYEMNTILQIMKLPWRATSVSSRWITAFVVLAIATIVVPLAGLYRGPLWLQFCAGLCCFAIAVLWLLVIPNALWLARDARALRLPKIARQADLSLVGWAALSVVLPALILGAIAGHALVLLTLFASIAGGCMAYRLLPSRIAIVLIVAAFAVGNLHLPAMRSVEFLAWSGPLAVALASVSIWRWLRLSRGASLEGGVLGAPALVVWRRRSTSGFLDVFSAYGDSSFIRSNAGWLQPIPNLRRVNPSHPSRALRMALSRRMMPQTATSRLRQWSITVFFVLLVVILVAGTNAGTRHDSASLFFLRSGWFWLQTGGIIVAILPLQIIADLRKRWTMPSAELALLGLMPGFGVPNRQKRELLRAVLLRPLYWLAAALPISVGAMSALHAPPFDFLFALLVVAGGAGLLACNVLGVVGGEPLSNLVASVMTIVLLILVIVTAMAFTQPALRVTTGFSAALVLLLLVWLVWLTSTAWLSGRGWHAMQRRPHPFLANAP